MESRTINRIRWVCDFCNGTGFVTCHGCGKDLCRSHTVKCFIDEDSVRACPGCSEIFFCMSSDLLKIIDLKIKVKSQLKSFANTWLSKCSGDPSDV